ncbi:MAG TPA: SDR family NAD(P)-dependent oxidoreductase [Stellaceae bacterium]|nr:SDR family NAD(P)-dependent oxidoreductase [Stellaceae bacterium]
MSFEGKVAMITGAAGNLGRAAAAAFAKAGARLALIDLRAGALDTAYGAGDGSRLHLTADLGQAASVADAVAKARATFGHIDALCNIAGGFHMGEAVHETPEEIWRQMIELNAGSIIRVAQAVVPVMLAQGGGRIVNVAAMGGLTGGATMGAYAASKSAVIRLTESMALELRDKGIGVNCVMPSTIDTPPNRASMPGADFSRWVAPDALADVILFLASDAARAVNGAAVPVVGRV